MALILRFPPTKKREELSMAEIRCVELALVYNCNDYRNGQ